jgi:hypothetical protein
LIGSILLFEREAPKRFNADLKVVGATGQFGARPHPRQLDSERFRSD